MSRVLLFVFNACFLLFLFVFMLQPTYFSACVVFFVCVCGGEGGGGGGGGGNL